MSNPILGFAGMTHLGLVSGVCAAEKGFRTVCFDPAASRIAALARRELGVAEPQLDDLVLKNASRLSFTSKPADLAACDVICVAPDVPTDDQGGSDLGPIDALLDIIVRSARADAAIVVLSQVPPGFTRGRQCPGRTLIYQVETLIFGRAVERALYPERYIVGCADPAQPLPASYAAFLAAYGCPVLPMRYESAELAKISINMCLVASVSTANTLAELCEKIGADWSEIVPALKLDKRIGQHAYLAPATLAPYALSPTATAPTPVWHAPGSPTAATAVTGPCAPSAPCFSIPNPVPPSPCGVSLTRRTLILLRIHPRSRRSRSLRELVCAFMIRWCPPP
jgi:UDPglucose 6-dehydrogenase